MPKSMINTPKLLSGDYKAIIKDEYNPVYAGAAPPVQGKKLSPVESISKEEVEEEMIYNLEPLEELTVEVQLEETIEKLKSISEKAKETIRKTTPISATDYSSKDKRYESVPSKFKVTRNMYKSKMKDIYRIVLHHTAGNMRDDHGKRSIKTWNGNSLGSHTIIDRDGHIEYVIPVPYGCHTQGQNLWVKGKEKLPKCVNFNNNSISTELVNYGFLSKSFKENGKTYWYRGDEDLNKKSKDYGVFEESLTSQAYDFQGNPMRKYKTSKRCVEYTVAQCNAMCEWTKKMQTFIANNYPSSKEILNWKFTEETYKQMFPNLQLKPIPKDWKKNGGYVVQDKLLIAGLKAHGADRNKNRYAFAVSNDCYENVIGIYSHNSISSGKSDIFPTKNMINALKKHFG